MKELAEKMEETIMVKCINSESIRKARYTNQLNENYRDIGVA